MGTKLPQLVRDLHCDVWNSYSDVLDVPRAPEATECKDGERGRRNEDERIPVHAVVVVTCFVGCIYKETGN